MLSPWPCRLRDVPGVAEGDCSRRGLLPGDGNHSLPSQDRGSNQSYCISPEHVKPICREAFKLEG